MNEDEWRTGADFSAHVRFSLDRLSPRRQRLLAAGFCRAIGDLFDSPDLLECLDVVERYADGLAPVDAVARARQRCREVAQESYDSYRQAMDADQHATDIAAAFAVALKREVRSELAWTVAFAATTPLEVEHVGSNAITTAVEARTGAIEFITVPTAEYDAACADYHRVMRGVVWEVVGNPFRAAHFSREWRTDTAVSLAQQMYDAREFGAMPILADALQDAGCDDEELLAHCRGEGNHVRGCWAVDLVLGRS